MLIFSIFSIFWDASVNSKCLTLIDQLSHNSSSDSILNSVSALLHGFRWRRWRITAVPTEWFLLNSHNCLWMRCDHQIRWGHDVMCFCSAGKLCVSDGVRTLICGHGTQLVMESSQNQIQASIKFIEYLIWDRTDARM